MSEIVPTTARENIPPPEGETPHDDEQRNPIAPHVAPAPITNDVAPPSVGIKTCSGRVVKRPVRFE